MSTLADRLYVQLGRTIAKLRDDQKLTQEQLAGKIKLTRTSITNIECGRQHIQLHTLYLLAQSLQVEVSDLLPSRKSLDKSQSRESVTVSDDQWVTNTTSLGKLNNAQLQETTD